VWLCDDAGLELAEAFCPVVLWAVCAPPCVALDDRAACAWFARAPADVLWALRVTAVEPPQRL